MTSFLTALAADPGQVSFSDRVNPPLTMRIDHSLQDTFELRGSFWRPANPDDRLSGILRYTPERIELELLGAFSSASAGWLSDAPVLVGATNEGDCTLLRAVQTHATSTWASTVDVEHTLWIAALLVIGEAYDSEEKMMFSNMAFGFDALSAWLASTPFQHAKEQSDAGERISVVRHQFPPQVDVALEGEAANLSIVHSLSSTGDPYRSFAWTSRTELGLRPLDPQPLTWFTERLSDLRAFIGLLCGEPVTPTSLRAEALEASFIQVSIFFSVVGEPSERPLHPSEMLLSYDRVSERFPQLLTAWFERRSLLKTTIALLFGTLQRTGLSSEFQFLALTQALETFHRRRYGGLYVPELEYHSLAGTLSASIPSDVPRDLRDALKAKIRFGNEFSQRRRFRDLVRSLEDGGRSAIAPDAEAFMQQVVEQRNYLTHYPVGDTTPMNSTELFYATVKLRGLLTLLLLAEIGITGEEAAEAVRRTRWHRGWIAPQL